MDGPVLVALDGSEQSWAALEYALAEFPEADLRLLTVIDPLQAGYAGEGQGWLGGEEWYERRRGDAEDRFEEARERAGERADTIETAVEVGRPARTIVEYAKDHDVGAVVMGSHGRSGVARILLGSVAERVVRRSPVPVTVVR